MLRTVGLKRAYVVLPEPPARPHVLYVDQSPCAPDFAWWSYVVITDGMLVGWWTAVGRKHFRRWTVTIEALGLLRQIGFQSSHSSLSSALAMIGLDDGGRAPSGCLGNNNAGTSAILADAHNHAVDARYMAVTSPPPRRSLRGVGEHPIRTCPQTIPHRGRNSLAQQHPLPLLHTVARCPFSPTTPAARGA
jgi:hypothetical protein